MSCLAADHRPVGVARVVQKDYLKAEIQNSGSLMAVCQTTFLLKASQNANHPLEGRQMNHPAVIQTLLRPLAGSSLHRSPARHHRHHPAHQIA